MLLPLSHIWSAMFFRLPLCALALSLTAVACSPIELQDHSTAAARLAPYPALVPIETALAEHSEARTDEDSAAELTNRAKALRARARALAAQNGG